MENSKFVVLFGAYSKQKLSKFWKYHEDNPHVFKHFKRLAWEYKNAGNNKCSAALIGNVIRWQVSIETQSEDGFKISNDWLPLYARLLVYTNPSFDEFFEFKK